MSSSNHDDGDSSVREVDDRRLDVKKMVPREAVNMRSDHGYQVKALGYELKSRCEL